jgi:aminoglycoside phosphotransferase (APT) family kinase protein
MRRKPPGRLLPSAHAVDREFRVISALYAVGFPVPAPLLLCEDEAIAGTVFFVMAYVEGRIFWNLDLPGLASRERSAIYDHVNRTIADLHSFDWQAIGLSEFGKPGNYFSRQIARWSKQYRASETGTIDAMDRLIEWLPGHIPEDESSSLVHGDYRLDNLILHPTEPRVIAVLDWELSTIGHPIGDFTYHLMAWQMPEIGIGSTGLKGKDLQSLGIPAEEEYVRLYCERTGRERIANRDFYSAYNFFRIAAILQGVAGRVRDGTAASTHAKKAAAAVRPLADLGWQFAQKSANSIGAH